MTKFEEDFEQMEIAFDEDKLELYDHLKAKFIAKYDPEKQPKPTDVQTEVIKKTTQFDTLDNPTHIIHPLGRGELDFEVKDAEKVFNNTFKWYWCGKEISVFIRDGDNGRLIFSNPFSEDYLKNFDIEKLKLNLPNE